VQFEDPSVTISYDWSVAEAAQQRRRIFSDTAQNGWLVGGAHLAFPGLGRLQSSANGATYSFVPLNYSTHI
jgi:hypothetical protein